MTDERRAHYFTIRPDSRELFVELMDGALASSATIELGAGDDRRARTGLFALLADHEIGSHRAAYGHITRKYRLTPETRTSLLAALDDFDSFPGDMLLRRVDGSGALNSICNNSSQSLYFTDEEYAEWRAATSIDLLWCLDAPHPGAVSPVWPLMYVVRDPARIRAALTGQAPIESPELRRKVACYLEDGALLNGGSATADVFDAAISIADGEQILTDGTFAWRREAAHYVRVYGIGVGAELIEHSTRLNFALPDLDEEHLEAIDNFIWERFTDAQPA